MRPDRRRRADLPIDRPDPAPVPFDAASDPDARELAGLEAELASAGERARTDRQANGFDRPGPAFATELRSRLVASYATAAAGATTPEPARPARGAAVAFPRIAKSAAARSAAIRPAHRWAMVAIAAAVAIAVLGSISGRFFPASLDARVTEAVGATIVRDGVASLLGPGTSLRAGDEIRVDATGRATLSIGAGLTRLAGGADLRLEDLSADGPRLDLLAGRSYHRVALPGGGAYVVTTGALRWTALGTAFDLDREPVADGRDRVTLLGLQHSVSVAGPDLQATVGEGRAATVDIGAGGSSDLAVGPIDPLVLHDPWLVANARRDRDLGFPLGVMGPVAVGPTATPGTEPPTEAPGSESPAASEAPEATASDRPTASPASNPATLATAKPTSKPVSKPTPKPTPEPTPERTPEPTPRPLASLGLDLTSCDGGIVIDWATYDGAHFDHYATLRNTSPTIPKADPPRAGATFVDGTYSRNRLRTSAYDAGLDAGTWYYRSMAFDAADQVIAASPVRSAAAKPVADLGPLTVGPGDGSTTAFSWAAYGGPAACFGAAKLVFSEVDPSPSSFGGSPVLFATGEQGVTGAVAELGPGTYHFRLQVVRFTDLGSPARFLVAQTAVATYTVP
jgi:hypothetical protein